MNSKKTIDKALAMLRVLPRVSLGNIRDNPGSKGTMRNRRGQHGGDRRGNGMKSNHLNFPRLGYETGNTPFYLRFGFEPYYKGHHLKRQYPPLSLLTLQTMVDTGRLDVSAPVDLVALLRTGLYHISPSQKHAGVQLTDDGADCFTAKLNLEVQWTTETVIAAIERQGGTITTAYYDPHSLFIMADPRGFFRRGEALPKRAPPPPDVVPYYTDPAFRGYLANPQLVSQQRLVLAQKYGYVLPVLEQDPDYNLLTVKKDPKQIFLGLEPGWVINLPDQSILKPKDKYLQEFYYS